MAFPAIPKDTMLVRLLMSGEVPPMECPTKLLHDEENVSHVNTKYEKDEEERKYVQALKLSPLKNHARKGGEGSSSKTEGDDVCQVDK